MSWAGRFCGHNLGQAGQPCAGSEVQVAFEPFLGRQGTVLRGTVLRGARVPQSAAACAALCSVSAAMIEAAVAKLARSSGVYPGRYSLPGCWTCGVMKGV